MNNVWIYVNFFLFSVQVFLPSSEETAISEVKYAKVGSNVTLSCGANETKDDDSFTEWTKQIIHWSGNAITLNVNTSKQFRLLSDEHQAVKQKLYLLHVSLDDTALYSCWNRILNQTYQIALIVTEHPTCRLTSGNGIPENKNGNISCVIISSPGYRPVLRWLVNVPEDRRYRYENQSYVEERVTLKPQASDHMTVYACLIVHNISAHESYDTCYLQLPVFFHLRNLTITPRHKYHVPGDRLVCSAAGFPRPLYSWKKRSGSGAGPDLLNGPVLEITRNMSGLYTYSCYASQVLNGDIVFNVTSQQFYVVAATTASYRPNPTTSIPTTTNEDLWIIVTISILATFIMTSSVHLTVETILRRRRRKKEQVDHVTGDITSNNCTSDSNRIEDVYEIDPTDVMTDKPILTSLKTDMWEIPLDNIQLLDKVGEGVFGQVWRAHAWKVGSVPGLSIVAAKQLKENACDKDKQDLLAELDLMKTVPRHGNVITLLGCITVTEPITILAEFAANGNLRLLLHQEQEKYMSQDGNGEKSRELIMFAWQISKGMDHISSLGLVHRDLAARNILVTAERVCKVADFGFARDVMDTEFYLKHSKTPVPIRWLAPESLTEGVYTTKSDSWAFGIVLWEIVTLGATPYYELSNIEVVEFVRAKRHMSKPRHCRRQIYNIMQSCWRQNPTDRPNFHQLANMLEPLLVDKNDYIDLSQYDSHTYYNSVEDQPTDTVTDV